MRTLGDSAQLPTLGHFGEVAEGTDGKLYQWVEGVDGLGGPVGFWKPLRKLIRRALPYVQKLAPLVPGWGTAAAAALNTATPYLKQAGLLGGLGALYQAPDGAMYQLQGVAGPDELNGYVRSGPCAGIAGDGELDGMDADAELDGISADELDGLSADELDGISADELDGISADELYGVGDEELNGPGPEAELHGYSAAEELQGLHASELDGPEPAPFDGFVAADDAQSPQGPAQSGVEGVDGYVPEQAPGMRWFNPSSSSPWRQRW
jgi:hypothetical protein